MIHKLRIRKFVTSALNDATTNEERAVAKDLDGNGHNRLKRPLATSTNLGLAQSRIQSCWRCAPANTIVYALNEPTMIHQQATSNLCRILSYQDARFRHNSTTMCTQLWQGYTRITTINSTTI